MNKQQLIDILKGVLVAGGPVVTILMHLFGMEQGPAEKIVQGLGALVSVAGMVWLAIGRTDRNMVLDAKEIKGVQVHVDTREAPKSVVETAKDPTISDVLPMIGGPRIDTNKTQ